MPTDKRVPTLVVNTLTEAQFRALENPSDTEMWVTPYNQSHLQNTATGTNALTIEGTPATTVQSHNVGIASSAGNYSVSAGYSASATSASTAIGTRATAGIYGVAIGSADRDSVKTEAIGSSSVAIGYNAKATANTAVQIGAGTNSTADTVQIKGTRVLDANGKIPTANLDVAKVSKTGDTMTGNLIIDNNNITQLALNSTRADSYLMLKDPNLTLGQAPTDEIHRRSFRVLTNDNAILGDMRVEINTEGRVSSTLFARSYITGTQVNSALSAYVDTNGIAHTSGVTPAIGSNGVDLATTAWVRNTLAENGGGLATFSKAANGYIKFSNEIILQWGTIILNYDTRATVNLPTPFSNGAYRVFTQNYNTAASSAGNKIVTSIYEQGTTGFNILVQRVESTAASIAQLTEWMAIGF